MAKLWTRRRGDKWRKVKREKERTGEGEKEKRRKGETEKRRKGVKEKRRNSEKEKTFRAEKEKRRNGAKEKMSDEGGRDNRLAISGKCIHYAYVHILYGLLYWRAVRPTIIITFRDTFGGIPLYLICNNVNVQIKAR